MKKFYTVLTMALATATLMACAPQEAEAAVGVTAGYQNNNVIGEQGLVLDASTVTQYNIKLGVNTLTQVEDAQLLSYGVYAGVPVALQNSDFTLTPSIGVDRYRGDIEETVGNVALNLDYRFDTTTYATIQTKYSKDFNSDEELKGESYTFGITKLF